MPVPSVDRGAQGVEVVAKSVQGAQHRLPVGEENVVPHHRIATGDPGEIAKAASSVAEDLQVLAALGQRVDQAEGQQVRQVAGRGQHLVVVLDLHVLDIGAQGAPQPVDQLQRLHIGVSQRREDHLVATKQLAVGRLHPTLFRAGDRMAGHEARRQAAESLTRGAHHIALGAADIGEDCPAQIQLGQFGQQFLHGQDRHRQLDHVGAQAGGGQVGFTAVDHAQFHRQAARLGIQVDAHHLAEQALLTQALGEGAADQAEPHHHQAAQRGDLSHAPAPGRAPRGSGRFPPGCRWTRAGRSACRSRPPGARSPRPAAELG
ncbi:hypothetical protein D9M70_409800 [compost metagenome]